MQRAFCGGLSKGALGASFVLIGPCGVQRTLPKLGPLRWFYLGFVALVTLLFVVRLLGVDVVECGWDGGE